MTKAITLLEKELEHRLDIYHPPEDVDERRLNLIEAAKRKIEAQAEEIEEWQEASFTPW